mmetsp:Transcript_24707/g.62094  ORF Transcript_24707/g.62094 Transcript_24707/m.62094 type:complete len:365 (+) Transcript_24707:3589-4683(+)
MFLIGGMRWTDVSRGWPWLSKWEAARGFDRFFSSISSRSRDMERPDLRSHKFRIHRGNRHLLVFAAYQSERASTSITDSTRKTSMLTLCRRTGCAFNSSSSAPPSPSPSSPASCSAALSVSSRSSVVPNAFLLPFSDCSRESLCELRSPAFAPPPVGVGLGLALEPVPFKLPFAEAAVAVVPEARGPELSVPPVPSCSSSATATTSGGGWSGARGSPPSSRSCCDRTCCSGTGAGCVCGSSSDGAKAECSSCWSSPRAVPLCCVKDAPDAKEGGFVLVVFVRASNRPVVLPPGSAGCAVAVAAAPTPSSPPMVLVTTVSSITPCSASPEASVPGATSRSSFCFSTTPTSVANLPGSTCACSCVS